VVFTFELAFKERTNAPFCAIVVLIIIIVVVFLSVFLPDTSLEPAVTPTALASSFTLQYFPHYV
jgi:hypothetical protein